MPAQNPMSNELQALLVSLGNGVARFPLIAQEGGRFPGIQPFDSSSFRRCRLPAEAHAGLLLYAGFGHQSHDVSQQLTSREASYWHAIYHRMEPDDSNAKYWFLRAGPHEIGPALAEASRNAGWNPGRNWEHVRFVDFVSESRISSDPSAGLLAEKIQLIEWQLLFDFCAKDVNE